MNLQQIATCFTFASSLICSSAVAQTRFCAGGDLDHLSSAQRSSCNAKVQTLRSLAAGMQAPEGWHFVVVCGEEGWQQYAEFYGNGQGGLASAAIDTRVEQHETFFREAMLSQNVDELKRVLGHELASIARFAGRQQASTETPLRRSGTPAGF